MSQSLKLKELFLPQCIELSVKFCCIWVKVYLIAGTLQLYSSFRENNSTGNFVPVVCFVTAICNASVLI